MTLHDAHVRAWLDREFCAREPALRAGMKTLLNHPLMRGAILLKAQAGSLLARAMR